MRVKVNLLTYAVKCGTCRYPLRIKCVLASGIPYVYLTAELFHQSTVFRHVNNLDRLLDEELLGHTTLVLLADNASDWNLSVGVNVLYFGRLFKKKAKQGLKRLIIIHYCPKYSRFNYIERYWGTFFSFLPFSDDFHLKEYIGQFWMLF